jgi:hypothetical protein
MEALEFWSFEHFHRDYESAAKRNYLGPRIPGMYEYFVGDGDGDGDGPQNNVT